VTDLLARATGRLDRIGRALDPSPQAARTIIDVAAPPLRADVEVVARDVFGGDLRPFRREAFVAAVSIDESSTSGRVRFTFQLRPSRAWKFGEKGAKPHVIGDQGRYLAAAGRHPYRGAVRHPGTTGRRAITQARTRVRNGARARVVAGIHAVIEATSG
jgi:hypothetical protein